MTTPGDEPTTTAGPARTHRRAVLVLVALAAATVVLGLVAVLVAQRGSEPNPLDADAPALGDFTMHRTDGCRYEPDRGGLVAHFDVSTSDAGRFTVDVEAVTDEGVDNLDLTTEHAVRFTVPFYGGPSRRQLDVVVPLTEADYQHGYRRCRFTINPTGSE
jgi:hypothetical protein